jgi:hypothetical protein
MKMASPQFIPLKRGKECLAVTSWRDSPSTKPLSPPPTPPINAEDKKQRRRGKSKGPLGDEFDDFIVRCVVPKVTASEIEEMLVISDVKPLRVMDIGSPRSVPLKRLDAEGDTVKDSPLLSNTDPTEVPPIALPPNASTSALEQGHLVCLMFAEHETAQNAVVAISKKWPAASTEIVARKRASLNASLVMKGLPFTTKCDKLVEELEKLTHKPSYVRLHRGERGVFKCVVFVKYPNRSIAEHSKLELERLTVGSRPLRVEFKKKSRDEGTKHPSLATLEQAVRDLRASKDHEGFFYGKSQLSKEEVKYLKHLTVSYDLILEVSAESVTVKRRIAGDKEKPSPALRPNSTPQWVPATPGSLLPMDFRGIRHWKEMRNQSSSSGGLGIVRPLGPGDTAPFSSGRGRSI